MGGARLVCSAGARSFGAGWEGASAGRGGGNGGDAAVDALETCSGKASSTAIMKKRECACAPKQLWRRRGIEGTFSRSAFSLWMTSARIASTFLAGAFCAASLLAQTGQAQLLRGSEPVTAKSQPGDDAARRAPLDSGASNDLGCANPLAEGARQNFRPTGTPTLRSGYLAADRQLERPLGS